jgi:hypothetical protein
MLMPEATVNENDLSVGRKNEVGTTGQICAMQAKAISQTMRQ